MKHIPLPRLAAASASTAAALGATAVLGATVATSVATTGATTGAEHRSRNSQQANPARQSSATSVPDPADEQDHLRAARLQARMNRVPSARPAPERDGTRASRTMARESLSGSPRELARDMLAEHGWSDDQYPCLDDLWERESGWNVHAENPSSGAYGIPQALPGSKMAAAGPDWQGSAATQITWGLDYIDDRYGTPCGAWDYWLGNNWY
ncbi:MAG: hypothetical protein ACRDPT_16355 [Streptomycetales bacterium]